MAIRVRSRYGVGALVSAVVTTVDGFARSAFLGQVGISVKPGTLAAHVLATIDSIPLAAYAIITITLGLIWVLYPNFEKWTPGWIEFLDEHLRVQTFRAQVYRLARALRKLASSGDIGASEKDFARFTARWVKLQPFYWAVKRNLENLVGKSHPAMISLTKTFPIGPNEYRRMAGFLELLAKDVPADALAIPIPKDLTTIPE